MKIMICFLVAFLSLPALACVSLKGSFDVDGKILKIDQKVDHDRPYSFMQDPYIINVSLSSGQKRGQHFLDITVDVKEGSSLRKVSSGKILVLDGDHASMKVTDNKTKKTFTYDVVVKNI